MELSGLGAPLKQVFSGRLYDIFTFTLTAHLRRGGSCQVKSVNLIIFEETDLQTLAHESLDTVISSSKNTPPQSRTSAALLSMCPKKVKDVASCHLSRLISICDIIDSE